MNPAFDLYKSMLQPSHRITTSITHSSHNAAALAEHLVPRRRLTCHDIVPKYRVLARFHTADYATIAIQISCHILSNYATMAALPELNSIGASPSVCGYGKTSTDTVHDPCLLPPPSQPAALNPVRRQLMGR